MVNSLLDAVSANQVLAILALLAFLLLVVVTLGVGYLTAVEWRDRRRRGNDMDAMPNLKGSRKK